MVQLTKQTPTLKEKNVKRTWHLIDAKDQVLGRCATQVSQLLIGKGKRSFTPHLDSGDYVVVINAKDVVLTGRKMDQKVYTRYSGYPGGLKEIPVKRLMEDNPTKVIQNAVSGMLPKNKHRKPRMKRLFVFTNEKHPYADKLQETTN